MSEPTRPRDTARGTLASLYPFLNSEGASPARSTEILLESIRRKAGDSGTVREAFFARNAPAVVAVAQSLAKVFRGGGRLFAMGNGGSSCDASHIVVEFSHPITTGRPALPAFNLVADTAMMTAVGNDVGFSHIFVRSLTSLAHRSDALVGISTSGNSENLLAAFAKARQMGLVTIGLAGGHGGRMAKNPDLDHCLVVESDSVHRVQECHVLIYHILWDLTHTLLGEDRGMPAAAQP